MEFEVKDERELNPVAEAIVTRLSGTPIVLFRGNLGAGKTTLIKRIGAKLGVTSEMSSPSFGLVNEYDLSGKTLYHIDLYRVEDISEIFEFGLPEILDSGSICLVEWPEMAEEIWQEYEYETVQITIDKQGIRRIFVE